MDKQQLINLIINIIKTNDIVKEDVEIGENTSLFNEGGLDSITIVELIIHIEEEFNFEFNDNDLKLDRFDKVSSIAEIVMDRIISER